MQQSVQTRVLHGFHHLPRVTSITALRNTNIADKHTHTTCFHTLHLHPHPIPAKVIHGIKLSMFDIYDSTVLSPFSWPFPGGTGLVTVHFYSTLLKTITLISLQSMFTVKSSKVN